MTRVLVIDNYDSFVYTLNGYLIQLGAETEVLRNDAFRADDAAEVIRDYDAVLLSPGPGTPANAGGPRLRSVTAGSMSRSPGHRRSRGRDRNSRRRTHARQDLDDRT
jgi:para-aminobenzoate synthetase component II